MPIPMLVKRFYKLHQAVLSKSVCKILSSTEETFNSCLETFTVLTSIDRRNKKMGRRRRKGEKVSFKMVA
jgi:hypothetical protein